MRIIELFKEITLIPRCSGTHKPFINFMHTFAKKHNYICKIDTANNILVYKEHGKPKLSLQSHYDIVCLKDNTIPDIIDEDGYLKAKNSTLGADNGIGCAYMLALIEEQYDIEYLFTCDEEIGLIGANNIEHSLKSSYMLNLDSEAQDEICIGCAGGIDIFAINNNSQLVENKSNKDLYEISISNLDGGHSGVDIDKNIPNAIKLLATAIKECDGDIIDINAGERINSIAKSAKAIIASNTTPIKTNPNMKIEKLDTITNHYKKLDSNILNFLYTFAHGVRAVDKELGVVLTSINLAIINTSINSVEIQLSARSMDNNELKLIKNETMTSLECFDFKVTTSGKYPAWKPEQSDFTKLVLNTYKKHSPNVSLEAIHAGLECAIFKDKYPNIEVCSIGPNIHFPHSLRETCEIKSTIEVFDILKDIVDAI